jgi:hypothetical protein
MTMSTQPGSHTFRWYLDPEYLLRLIGLPDGFSVRTVAWQEDRQAFIVYTDGPEDDDRFFVPQNEIIPLHPAAITIVQAEDGDGIHIRFPQFQEDEPYAADKGPSRKARRRSEEVVEAAQR